MATTSLFRMNLRSKLLILMLVPLTCAIVLGLSMAWRAHERAQKLEDFRSAIHLSEALGEVREGLARESIYRNAAMVPGHENPSAARQKVVEWESKVDAALDAFAGLYDEVSWSGFSSEFQDIAERVKAHLDRREEHVALVESMRYPKDLTEPREGETVDELRKRSETYKAKYFNSYEEADALIGTFFEELRGESEYTSLYVRLQAISQLDMLQEPFTLLRGLGQWALQSDQLNDSGYLRIVDFLAAYRRTMHQIETTLDDDSLVFWEALVDRPEHRAFLDTLDHISERGADGPYDIELQPFRDAANYVGDEGITGVQADLARNLNTKANAMIDEALARRNVTLAGVGLAIFMSLFVGLYFTRDISRILRGVVASVSESATGIAEASTQINYASQSVADGASRQAASVEETSASIEELSAMTSSNAESASATRDFIRETTEAIEASAEDMRQLNLAMEQMSKKSEETQRIIKSIDEIAFQTNILALNAAVEAARAGEAGAGFAVVADEVRALAQRAAKASTETARLIEESSTAIQEGVGYVERVTTTFRQAEGNQKHSLERIDQIAESSREQSVALDQVSSSTRDLDSTTQQNAASAEECAAGAQELSQQAAQLRSLVAELNRFVQAKAAEQMYEDAASPMLFTGSSHEGHKAEAQSNGATQHREAPLRLNGRHEEREAVTTSHRRF